MLRVRKLETQDECAAVQSGDHVRCDPAVVEVFFGTPGIFQVATLCRDHAVQLLCDLEELLKPKPVRRKCIACKGSGIVPDRNTEYMHMKCPSCNGECGVWITPDWRPPK